MRCELTSVARTLAVGVVVPVHNEQESLGSAFAALTHAFERLSRWNLSLRAAVVLDACSDVSEALSREWQCTLARSQSPLEVTVLLSGRELIPQGSGSPRQTRTLECPRIGWRLK
jgi:hypothetical protein